MNKKTLPSGEGYSVLPRFLCNNLLVSLGVLYAFLPDRKKKTAPTHSEEMRRRSGFWYLLDAPTQRFGICLSDIGDSAGNVERHVDRLADVVRGEIVAVVQPLQEGDVVLIAQAVGEAESVDLSLIHI